MRGRLLTIWFVLAAGAVPVQGETYLGYEEWGGTWADAEKSPASAEDDLMCWAAASANILEWTGWGQMGSYEDADEIFKYFQDHWTDAGGLMQYGWNWWFDGANPSQKWTGWSHVDSPGGGFAEGTHDFQDYFYRTSADGLAMSAIDEYLHSGLGVGIILTKPGRSHAVTSWGYEHDGSEYVGVWITDSDDSRGSTDPPYLLQYVAVTEADGRWYLQDYRRTDAWYINEVQALARNPAMSFAALPEPTSALLMGLAVLALRPRR